MTIAGPGHGPASQTQLPAVLDLEAADALCQSLREALALDDIDLDGGAVERVATPCLQLLLSAAISAAGRGAQFRITAPSEALCTAVAELGLSGLLALER